MGEATSDATASRKRTLLRFGLRTAFLFILVAAIGTASFRAGFERGRAFGPVVPVDVSSSNLYSREYDVGDLVASKVAAKDLVESLRKIAEPDSWDVVGGFAEVTFDDTKKTLIVAHVWMGHTAVVRYLSTVREFHVTGADIKQALSEAEREWSLRSEK